MVIATPLHFAENLKMAKEISGIGSMERHKSNSSILLRNSGGVSVGEGGAVPHQELSANSISS